MGVACFDEWTFKLENNLESSSYILDMRMLCGG